MFDSPRRGVRALQQQATVRVTADLHENKEPARAGRAPVICIPTFRPSVKVVELVR